MLKASLIIEALVEMKGKVRIGGLTIYKQNGKICKQLSKRKDCSNEKWKRTEKREKNVAHFAAMRRVADYLAEVYKELPVWRLAAKRCEKRMPEVSYLMRVMWAYFDERGRVMNFEGLPLSEGGLVPPSGMSCEYADGTVRLRWSSGDGGYGAHLTDRLVVMYVREAKAGHVGKVKGVTATRRDGEVSFPLQITAGERVHLYPFFAAADLSDFSRNAHVCVEEAVLKVDMGTQRIAAMLPKKSYPFDGDGLRLKVFAGERKKKAVPDYARFGVPTLRTGMGIVEGIAWRKRATGGMAKPICKVGIGLGMEW